MTTETKAGRAKRQPKEERPFAQLRATPEELERLRAMAPPPRSLEEWLRPPLEATEEELADLEWFLQEREAIRQHDLKRQEERLAELEE
jgi:hypothetical protein